MKSILPPTQCSSYILCLTQRNRINVSGAVGQASAILFIMVLFAIVAFTDIDICHYGMKRAAQHAYY
ncbi:hypothetical protein [Ulvibacter sp. MAR_2010_11]|uniref:hypothetical protein n=1 Tax=Ulvibacter sp. MAR_2010_11 TaxID=1250229 RepID=UPI0012FE2DFF|nr:hypothetical protein [Ulvibacter sp. MAR_2010_11]